MLGWALRAILRCYVRENMRAKMSHIFQNTIAQCLKWTINLQRLGWGGNFVSLGDSALQQSAFFLPKLFMEPPTFCCQNKKHFVTSEPLLAKVFFLCLHSWDQFGTNCISDGKKCPQVFFDNLGWFLNFSALQSWKLWVRIPRLFLFILFCCCAA